MFQCTLVREIFWVALRDCTSYFCLLLVNQNLNQYAVLLELCTNVIIRGGGPLMTYGKLTATDIWVGTQRRSWFRYCVASRKVMGLISDGVI